MLNKIKRRLGFSTSQDTPTTLPDDIPVPAMIENSDELDALLEDLIDQSTDYVCLYLGTSEIKDFRLNSVVINMVIDAFNKLGDEGKETTIYSDYRSDYATELIAPYISILDAVKRDTQIVEEATIRFI